MHRLGGSGGSSQSDGGCADPAPMMSPLRGGRPEPDGVEMTGISLCGAYAAICSSNADWLANSGKKAPSDAGSKPGVVHDAGCSSTSHCCWPPSILVNKNNVLNISYKSCHVNCSFCDSFCTPQCDSMILPSAACIERAVNPLLVRPIRRFLMRFSCRRFLIYICSSASASTSSSPFLPPRTPTFLPASYGLVYLPYVFKGLLGCAGIGHSRSCSPMAPARN
ncbi:hypothetical protein PVAP13_7NG025100 [Panicum virgatum]|uniref:Uncharacterized protein n=1 Tax=Panicum virgatum TaxID=38727 RepID=A0A8T0PXP7_PANVG|nr:hypothetical protein PVAP13_7NG025100 [Panicum virgatum]